MVTVLVLILAAAMAMSWGCSDECPCAKEISNISARLDTRATVEESYMVEVAATLKRIGSSLERLTREADDMKEMKENLNSLNERFVLVAQKIGGSDQKNCTAVKKVKNEDVPQDAPVKKPQDDPKQCPAGWVSFGGSCYYFQLSRKRLTQDTAQTQCNSLYTGSSLVAIETAAEFKFLKDYLSKQYSTVRTRITNGWLTSGKKVNGKWIWEATGSPVDLKALTWASGRPKALTCMSFWPKSSFNLSDVFCSSFERQFICEI